jgi:hypothetical protein
MSSDYLTSNYLWGLTEEVKNFTCLEYLKVNAYSDNLEEELQPIRKVCSEILQCHFDQLDNLKVMKVLAAPHFPLCCFKRKNK